MVGEDGGGVRIGEREPDSAACGFVAKYVRELLVSGWHDRIEAYIPAFARPGLAASVYKPVS